MSVKHLHSSLRLDSARLGFSLMEMIVAIGISSILVVSLSSVVLLSSRTLGLQDSASARASENARLLSQIRSDLQLATEFITANSTKISFKVPDRDGDLVSEQITYEWAQAPDLELRKTVQLSSETSQANYSVIAEDIQRFDLKYETSVLGDALVQRAHTTAERVLYSHDDTPGDSATNVLMIVSSSASATQDELDRKRLLESWSFSVTLAGASDYSADVAALLDANQLVYVVAAPDQSIWGDSLTDTSLGIVNESTSFAEQLGFGLGKTLDSKRLSNVSESAHFIMSETIQGALPLYNDRNSSGAISETHDEYSNDLQTLARWTGGAAVSVLDLGAERFVAAPPPLTFGYTDAYASLTDPNSVNDVVLANRVSLDKHAKVDSLAVLVDATSASSVVMGIYRDSNGAPGELVAETERVSIDSAVTSTWIVGTLAETTVIEPGTYWLAVGIPSHIKLHFENNTSSSTLLSGWDNADSGGLNQTWGPSTEQQMDLSLYANFVEFEQVAGRRIQLPWESPNVTVEDLSSDASEILKRSLQWAGDETPSDSSSDFSIGASDDFVQYFEPQNSPANAEQWVFKRARIAIKKNPSNSDGRVRFSLHSATSGQEPDDLLYESDWISIGTWASEEYIWYEIPLFQTNGLSSTQGLCLKVEGETSSGVDAFVKYDPESTSSSDTTPPSDSSGPSSDLGPDSGSGSGAQEPGDARLYIYGLFETDGVPQW